MSSGYAKPKELEAIFRRITPTKFFFEISLPAAIAKAKLGHILFLCPDAEITENFLELLKFKLAGKSEKSCALSYETAPGDIAAMLTSTTETTLLVFQSKTLDLSDKTERVLKKAISEFSFEVTLGKGPDAKAVQLDLPKFTSVFCVNKPSQTLLHLLPCFEYVIRIDESMLAQHCEEMLAEEVLIKGLNIGHEEIAHISKTAQFKMNTAKRYLNRIEEYAAFKQLSDKYISRQFIEEVFCLTGISEECTVFTEPDAAQCILEEIRNTLRTQQLGIASIQSDASEIKADVGLLLNE